MKIKSKFMNIAFTAIYIIAVLVFIKLIFESVFNNKVFPYFYYAFTAGFVVFYNGIIPKYFEEPKYLKNIRYFTNVVYLICGIYVFFIKWKYDTQ